MKIKALFLTTITFLSVSNAQAFLGDLLDNNFTKITNPEIVCQAEGGIIAINIKDKRVWLGEDLNQEAFELNVNEVSTLRCPNCYDIYANYNVFGESADVVISTRSQGLQPMTGTFTVKTQEGDSDSLSLSCKRL